MRGKQRLLVYDLDGCVVDSSARLKRHVDVAAKDRGDVTAYTHSFFKYGQSTDGDVPIVRGIAAVQALAEAYRADTVVALTSRGNTGRIETEKWMRLHLPWETGGELLIMHQELHYGFAAEDHPLRTYPSTLAKELSDGKPRPLWRGLAEGVALGYGHGEYVAPWDLSKDVAYSDDVWYLPVRSDAERFDPALYKKEVVEVLLRDHDVVLAIDDHPEVITAYQSMGVDAIRFVWAGIDCLTPAGDPKE